ncbi:PepSY-associated TM helix domain-containing protein [Alteromonas sp. LTR]|nr:PepSY-associated TM helix domain-containing protein [Alteromonas sp. LTR]
MIKKSSPAIKLMRWVHQWLGLIAGILLFFAVVTATYLAGNGVVSGISRTFVSSGVPVEMLSAQEKAVYTQQLFEKYPKAKSLTFPTESVPYFEMFKSGGRVLIDKNLEVIDSASPTSSSIRRFMFFMHRNFFLSKVGAQINATMSIITVALSVIGVILLIPIWRSIKLKHAVPKNTKRASLIRSHQLLGLFIFVPLVVAALTGAALTWRDTTNTLLSSGVNFTDKKRVQNTPTSVESTAILVQQQWPDKALLNVFKRGARRGNGAAYTFRFETSGFKWLDGFDTISVSYPRVPNMTFSEFASLPINEQIRGLIRSLHDGLRMPLGYEVWLFLTMLLSSHVIGASVFSFTHSLVKKRR